VPILRGPFEKKKVAGGMVRYRKRGEESIGGRVKETELNNCAETKTSLVGGVWRKPSKEGESPGLKKF